MSTLDGKISALNIDDGGSEQWNVHTGPGPMLSSSIHRLEVRSHLIIIGTRGCHYYLLAIEPDFSQ